MNINCDYSTISFESKTNEVLQHETKKIIRLLVDDFAIPYISGLSLETISQASYTLRGGKGVKPPALSIEVKRKLHFRIERVFYTHLNHLISQTIKPEIERRVFYGLIPDNYWTCLTLAEPNFDYKCPISQYDIYIKTHYPGLWSLLTASIQAQAKTFVPDIYQKALLDEVIKNDMN